ncbi:Molybdopterin synthase catalytic subunit [bacterium HR17]|uniref:Molybdopterin synthase catalytic subunit n=1 Tax=Candidatus Fervidibacter japonicus TaxID=2035412 RepID=A0A2H5XCJ5_9BACT|nr:Molybdopterin synthase catalytic subunit [bacterium HR17]
MAPQVQVHVQFFGPTKDLTGCERVTTVLPATTSVATVMATLAERFPSLQELLPHCRLALNGRYVEGALQLRDGDHLALIPPVSGGSVTASPFVAVTDQPINVPALLHMVETSEAGAVVTFLGAVRRHSHGKTVTAVTYEAFVPMAEQELQRIGEEMQQRWQLSRVALVHRVGTLSVGEVSVAIVVAAPHRADAFDAARYAIERIKEIVPIWKREHFADGSSQWVTPLAHP